MTNNAKNACTVYVTQGSLDYRTRLTEIGTSIDSDATVLGSISKGELILWIIINLNSVFKEIGNLKFYLKQKNNCNVLYDGLRPKDKQNSRLFKCLYVLYYFFIAVYIKGKKKTGFRNFLIMPDEAYGCSLIACLYSEENDIVLTNFTDTGDGELPFCTVSNFPSPRHYEYYDRGYWDLDDRLASTFQKERTNMFFDQLLKRSIKNSKGWRNDLLRGNNLDDKYSIKSIVAENNILIAGHILADFPAGRNWNYSSFEDWTLKVAPIFLKAGWQVFYKIHPATKRYYGEEKRIHKLLSRSELEGIKIINSDEKVNLGSFNAVMSANGSILLEAALKGLRGITVAKGATVYLQNVNFLPEILSVEDLQFLMKPAPKLRIEDISLLAYYWYCRDFSSIKSADEWSDKLMPLLNKVDQDCYVHYYCETDLNTFDLIKIKNDFSFN